MWRSRIDLDEVFRVNLGRQDGVDGYKSIGFLRLSYRTSDSLDTLICNTRLLRALIFSRVMCTCFLQSALIEYMSTYLRYTTHGGTMIRLFDATRSMT